MTLGQIKKPLSSKNGSATLRNSDTVGTFRKLFNMNWTIMSIDLSDRRGVIASLRKSVPEHEHPKKCT